MPHIGSGPRIGHIQHSGIMSGVEYILKTGV